MIKDRERSAHAVFWKFCLVIYSKQGTHVGCSCDAKTQFLQGHVVAVFTGRLLEDPGS